MYESYSVEYKKEFLMPCKCYFRTLVEAFDYAKQKCTNDLSYIYISKHKYCDSNSPKMEVQEL